MHFILITTTWEADVLEMKHVLVYHSLPILQPEHYISVKANIRLSNLCYYPQMRCTGIKITSASCHIKTLKFIFLLTS